MKRIIIDLIIPGMVAGILAGCYYDEVEVYDTLPQNVSFKNDVQPILTQNCTTSGCHDITPSHDPSMVPEKSYDALTGGNYINTVQPEKSIIYLQISGGLMPPSGPISTNDQKIILAWITEGAKDN